MFVCYVLSGRRSYWLRGAQPRGLAFFFVLVSRLSCDCVVVCCVVLCWIASHCTSCVVLCCAVLCCLVLSYLICLVLSSRLGNKSTSRKKPHSTRQIERYTYGFVFVFCLSLVSVCVYVCVFVLSSLAVCPVFSSFCFFYLRVSFSLCKLLYLSLSFVCV
jgi:hypothetical protein